MYYFEKYKFHFITSILIILIMGLLFNKPLTGEFTFSGVDSLSPRAINQGIITSQADHNKYPLWLPWVFSGLPSVHSFQNISNYYFPNLLNNFLQSIGFPKFWNYMIHFVISGLGILLLCTKLGLSRYSSLFGVIAYVLMPYSITMVVHGHGSQLMTLSWLPWFIWGILNVHSSMNMKSIGVLAAIVGFQLQRAHVQIAYYSWMAACLLVLILLYNNRHMIDKQYKWILYVAFGLFLGLCMAMWIYLPALNYTPYSIRGAGEGGGTGLDYATAWSFSLSEMSTFFIPSFYGFGGATYWGNMPFTDYPNYMGILVIIFSIIGILFSKNKIKWFFIIAMIFSLLLSFGKNFFLYEFFYNYFPLFNKFRVPSMFLVLTQFSTVVMAVFGLEIIMKLIDEKIDFSTNFFKKILSIPIFVIILLIVLKVFLFPSIGDFPRYPQINLPKEILDEIRNNLVNFDFYKSIIIIVISLILFYFSYIDFIKRNIMVSIFCLISFIDIYLVDRAIIEPDRNSLRSSTMTNESFHSSYLNSDEIIEFLQNDTSKYRILPLGPLANENRWSAFRIESISGYHPAKLANYNMIKNQVGWSALGVLQMLNVKYIVTLDDLRHPDFKLVFSGKLLFSGKYVTAHIFEFNRALPRVFFTEELVQITNESDKIDFLNNRSFNPALMSFIENEPELILFNSNSEIEVKYWSPDKISLNVNVSSKQLLVLSEIFYPEGWIITSHPDWEIHCVNHLLRGIYVPPGKHEIILEFIPNDIYYGKLITITSTILIIILIILGLYKEKRHFAS